MSAAGRVLAGIPAVGAMGAVVLWISLQGCEVPFEPFEDSGRVSAFGALDAAADTQWIRITPLRYSLVTSPDPIVTTVTLERVGTGRAVELRDSIVRFETGGPLTTEAEWFTHNFWTTEPIESGATYAVTITDPHRPTAVITVPIPEDYAVTVGYRTTPGVPASLRTERVEHLGLVIGRLHFDPGCIEQLSLETPFFSILFPFGPAVSPGVHQVEVFPFTRDESLLPCPVVRRDILIVASGSPWPEGLHNATSALGVPNAPTNVENGVGFVAGVRTRTIPWEPCTLEPSGGPCLLTYDSMSVTLRGTVRDRRTGSPLQGAALRLAEILPGSSPPTMLRGSTDDQGFFELGALEPGVHHFFRVSHPAHCWGNSLAPPVFLEHTDTLSAYAPAERGTVGDVVLKRNPDPGCAGYGYPSDSPIRTSNP